MDREAFQALEGSVGRALERIRALERQLADARERGEELDDLLRTFQAGERSPEAMKHELERLQAENDIMRDRLERGRESAERLLARIRFLEEQK